MIMAHQNALFEGETLSELSEGELFCSAHWRHLDNLFVELICDIKTNNFIYSFPEGINI